MLNAEKIADLAWNGIFEEVTSRGPDFMSEVTLALEGDCSTEGAVSIRLNREDIVEVIGAWYGEAADHMKGVPQGEGLAASGIFRLKDGRFASILWCKIHKDGRMFVSSMASRRLEDLLRGLDDHARAELGLTSAYCQ